MGHARERPDGRSRRRCRRRAWDRRSWAGWHSTRARRQHATLHAAAFARARVQPESILVAAGAPAAVGGARHERGWQSRCGHVGAAVGRTNRLRSLVLGELGGRCQPWWRCDVGGEQTWMLRHILSGRDCQAPTPPHPHPSNFWRPCHSPDARQRRRRERAVAVRAIPVRRTRVRVTTTANVKKYSAHGAVYNVHGRSYAPLSGSLCPLRCTRARRCPARVNCAAQPRARRTSA